MIVNYNSRVIPVAWITSVEGDEQPNWPRQKAILSMKVNIFCFSYEYYFLS